jgi:hypothetical protein
MLSYRFSNRTQKEVHLATLRDLMVEHHEDQIAKTTLSNAIAMAEGTMVTGQLDDMIARTNRMHRNGNITLSVFFVLLALLELAFSYEFSRSWIQAIPTIAFAVSILTYVACLWALFHIQRRYYTSLKWLEDHQLELPPMSIRLARRSN